MEGALKTRPKTKSVLSCMPLEDLNSEALSPDPVPTYPLLPFAPPRGLMRYRPLVLHFDHLAGNEAPAPADSSHVGRPRASGPHLMHLIPYFPSLLPSPPLPAANPPRAILLVNNFSSGSGRRDEDERRRIHETPLFNALFHEAE